MGQDPNITLAQLTHDIAWGPDGLAITGTLDNSVYKFKMQGLTPPRGKHSTLIRNGDGTYTRTLKNGTTINFDSNGYQTLWADRNGNTTNYAYDSGDKLKTITGPTGETTTFNYNNGKLQSITDPVGRTTIFQHDTDGNLTTITDPDNSITTYTYDAKHLATSKQVPTGETYSYEYDAHNRIVKSTSPNGEIRQYKSGKMAVVVNDIPAGEGTIGNPAKLKSTSLLVNTYTDSEGNTVNTAIDIDGYIIEKTDVLDRTSSYERDNDRNITRITRPNGEVETMTYDNTGNLLTTTTSSDGGTTTFTYEQTFNNITSITDPKGNTTTMEYDSKGNLTEIIDPLVNQTTMVYDGRGLLINSTDSLGNSATFTYDGLGNLASATGPLGDTTIFTYDPSGNLDSATDAGVKTATYEYDIVNNLIKTTAADGIKTSFTYGSGERCQPCGATNGGDLLTSINDANNNTTTFGYNEVGQLTETTNPAGIVTAYAYDTDRKLISKTDPNLQATTYQYDAVDRLTQKDFPSDTVKYTYNPSDSLTSVEDSDSLVFMDYDLQNRLVLENAMNTPGSVTITQDLTISAGNPVLDNRDITVDGATLTLIGAHTFNNLTLTNNASVTHPVSTTTAEYSLEVTVTNTLSVDASSSIDVTDKGYLGGYRGGNSSIYGRTLGNTTTGGSYHTSGGSYGGLSGQYSGDAVNGAYGSIVDPDELGSGGGGLSSYYGGNGGGLVRILANDMELNGSINANGGDGNPNSHNGGGSGGGVYINTGTLSGTGMITANGGKNNTIYSLTTGGGGGRIAVYYNDMSGFNTANITAYGGIGYDANGGAGTIYTRSSAQTYGDLIVDNNNIVTSGYSTPLVSIGTGMSTGLTADTLTDTGRNWLAGDIEGIRLNPNINQIGSPTVFEILSNDSTSITIDNTINYLTDVAVAGDSYIGELYIDYLYIKNGAKVETFDRIYFTSLVITGGELQAENIYQVGKAETKPEDVIGEWSLVSGHHVLPPLTFGTKTGISKQCAVGNRQKDSKQYAIDIALNAEDVVAGFLPGYVIQAGRLREAQSVQNSIPDTQHQMRDSCNMPTEIAKIEADLAPCNSQLDLVGPVNPVKNEETISPRALRLKENLQTSPIRLPLPTGQAIDNQTPILLASLAPVTSGTVFSDQTVDTCNMPAGIAKIEAELAPGNSQHDRVDPVNPVKKRETISPRSPRSPRPLRLAKFQCSSGVDPQYTYDLNGNRASMITPYGTFTYAYDALNRVTSITNPNNEVTTFGYDAISRRTSMAYDNGVVTTYSFDAASRLTNLSNDLGATNITNNSYLYDSVGNRTSMTDSYGTSTYQYDDVYRLTNATHPQLYNPTETLTYDPVGNRLTSHLSGDYVYDNLNRLLEDGSYTYSYDNNGNLTGKVDKATSATTTYQYDGGDRLTQVATPTDIVLYQYDGFGRRISKSVNGVVTKYVYDREDILFEFDENDQIKARYTHGPGIDEPISVDRDTDSNGTLETTYYYQYDGLGSAIAITDSSGNVVQTYEYDAFGKIVQQTGSIENSYTYTGREWDAEAGLYYYRARYYDPILGRFINGDPIGFAGGDVNFYVYVQNNPVNFVDPEGKFFNFVTGGIGAAIGSAVGATNAIFNGGSIWKGAAIGAGTGALAGFTFGGSIWAQAAIHGALSAGSDIFQQKLTNPCDDLKIGSVVASGIAGTLGGGLGKILIKPGGMTPANSAVLAGGLAGIANVFLTGAIQPVYK